MHDVDPVQESPFVYFLRCVGLFGLAILLLAAMIGAIVLSKRRT